MFTCTCTRNIQGYYHRVISFLHLSKKCIVTVRDIKFSSGQFVYASSIFPICSHSQASMRTIFFDPSLHAAKICFFIVHSFDVGSKFITSAFAVVRWLLCHPRHAMGRPLQLWYLTYEQSPCNLIIPLGNISSLLLTVKYMLEEETVLVTTPTLL